MTTKFRILFIFTAFMLTMFSTAWAEDVSILLEKAIYAEETKGDLDEAIEIYEEIIFENENQRMYAAKAYHRLGICYLKKGDDEMAQEAFINLLKKFPDQKQLVAEAKSQLETLGVMDWDNTEDQLDNMPLEIGPAPWRPGERCWYSIKTITGLDLGKQISTVDEIFSDGNYLWQIEQYLSLYSGNSQQFSRVDAYKDSFLPYFGRTKNVIGDFKAVYGEENIELETANSGNKIEKEIPLDNIAYDNEQVLYLIRRLPFADNYTASFFIFSVQSGAFVPCSISVQGREAVTVPAGIFNCYKLELVFNSGDTKPLPHTLWISNDYEKYLVKYDSRQIIIELEDVTQKPLGNFVQFEKQIENDEAGLSLSVPADWLIFEDTSYQTFDFKIQMIPPELRASAAFERRWIAPLDKPLHRIVSERVVGIKKVVKNYVVRRESKKSFRIAGLHATSFIADYDYIDRQKVEYRIYILDRSRLYWFYFRSEKEMFDEYKPEFDAIIQGLNIIK